MRLRLGISRLNGYYGNMARKNGFKKVHSSANTLTHKSSRRRFAARLRRHLVSILLVLVSVAVALGFLVWYSDTVSSRVSAEERALSASLEAMDAQLEAIKQRKAAEEIARKEAAAALAAEQARSVDSAEAAAYIDSASCNTFGTHNNPALIDVLVNKKHCIQPVTFAPDDLVTTYGATISAKAADAFNSMYLAATQAGQGFSVTSSYRSYSLQVATYSYWVSVSGQDGADTYSARPGYSEHQTGFAVDVATGGCALDCFGSTTQYAWLQANAADYGFIQRYYAGYEDVTGYNAEEWHYRYVGVSVAKDMQAKNIKTLEEYWGISGGGY